MALRELDILASSAAVSSVSSTHGMLEDDSDTDFISLEELWNGAERVGGMVVASPAMRKVIRTIARLGPYKATVLIEGESGTGK
ncbi:MAG TPA: sigma 54-interacting transcriptional regulator, partial [Candidatus Binataceae bacterium]|nr:sigma 54-interacting transcriptional regulator [Candidatus Binataceae bacterium]